MVLYDFIAPFSYYRFLWLCNIKATLKHCMPRRTKHMAKDGQVCFHTRLFADSVKPQRCTTKPLRPLNGINKDMDGAKLLLMTTSVYPVDCACNCPLLRTQQHYLCSNGRCNPPLASHPLPPHLIHAIPDITVNVKRLLKIQQC